MQVNRRFYQYIFSIGRVFVCIYTPDSFDTFVVKLLPFPLLLRSNVVFVIYTLTQNEQKNPYLYFGREARNHDQEVLLYYCPSCVGVG